jgi:hypothetical protein
VVVIGGLEELLDRRLKLILVERTVLILVGLAELLKSKNPR